MCVLLISLCLTLTLSSYLQFYSIQFNNKLSLEVVDDDELQRNFNFPRNCIAASQSAVSVSVLEVYGIKYHVISVHTVRYYCRAGLHKQKAQV